MDIIVCNECGIELRDNYCDNDRCTRAGKRTEGIEVEIDEQ